MTGAKASLSLSAELDDLINDLNMSESEDEFEGRAMSAHEDEIPAWDLPEEMLGGLPMGFEVTRRACAGLTNELDDKKAKIEALLERMARLKERYARISAERGEVEQMLLEAQKKAVPLKRRHKKKNTSNSKNTNNNTNNTKASKKKNEDESRRDKENAAHLSPSAFQSTSSSPSRFAHPLDEHVDFQREGVEVLQRGECNARLEAEHARLAASRLQPQTAFAHPLDEHFELGAELEGECAAEAALAAEQTRCVTDWIMRCREPSADPFGELSQQLGAAFGTIQTTMRRIEGSSSTQTFKKPKGEETCLLEMLEAREAALTDARDDLEQLHADTDEAVYRWENLYCTADQEPEVDDPVLSPEEARLLVFLGKNLHDYVFKTQEHKDFLLHVSHKFEAGEV